MAEELERLDAILEGGRALAQRDGRLDGGGRREGHLGSVPVVARLMRHAFQVPTTQVTTGMRVQVSCLVRFWALVAYRFDLDFERKII